MTAVAAYARATGGVVRRDAALFFSYRTRLITQTGSALFTLALFYFVSRLITVGRFSSPDAYYEYVVVGLVIMSFIASAIGGTSLVLRTELVGGTMERLVLSPFGPVNSLIAMMFWPFVHAVINGALILLLGCALFGMSLDPVGLALAVPVAVLAAIAFAPFGVLISAAILIVKQVTMVEGFVMAGLAILAGVYFPIALLPDWIRWASEVQPFTPAVDLMRHVMSGSALRQSAAVEVLKLVGFAVVLLPAAVVALRAAVGVGRRRGTITEY